MIPPWNGKNPIYFGVITIIPFDNLYRQAYFVMHTFLVPIYCLYYPSIRSTLCQCVSIYAGISLTFLQIYSVFTLNFLPYKPTGPASSNIYRPTINSTGPNLKTTLMTINSNHQNIMMYQILCGHVNYALGKTRMQVKKTKTLYFGFK